MLDRMQRASEYLHKGMDQLPNGFNEKSCANLGGAAEGMLRKAGWLQARVSSRITLLVLYGIP
jgi:hypothetical protein